MMAGRRKIEVNSLNGENEDINALKIAVGKH